MSGGRPRLLLIDNVDSFTFMLADTLRRAGAEVTVARNDQVTVATALDRRFNGVVISPGPGRPEEAGPSVAIAAACIAVRKPLLGICLGHQAIAIACGGKVERVTPIHGKIGPVRHDGSGVFDGLPSPLEATRYHSLAAVGINAPLLANAWSEDGTVMGLRHADAPSHGLQFHPESVATPDGLALMKAFLNVLPRAA